MLLILKAFSVIFVIVFALYNIYISSQLLINGLSVYGKYSTKVKEMTFDPMLFTYPVTYLISQT